MLDTFRLSTTSQSDKVAQKRLILAISLTAGSKSERTLWGKFLDFFKVFPQDLKCYSGYLDRSSGLREGIWTPETPQMIF